MKASELRIGNWIKIKEEFSDREFPLKTLEFEIKGFNDGSGRFEEGAKQILFWTIPNKVFGKTHSGSYDIECEPISLTEEWLLKFNFTRHHVDYSNDVIYIKNVPSNNEFEWGVYPNELGSGIQIKNRKLIQYVHQLQNLYFALTGEELEIKDKNITE